MRRGAWLTPGVVSSPPTRHRPSGGDRLGRRRCLHLSKPPPGTYDLTATLTGFREHTQRGIPVAAGNPVRLNIALAVGALTESVEVVSQTHAAADRKSGSEHAADVEGDHQSPAQPVPQLPGAHQPRARGHPAVFQNAEIDTPGRSLRTWVNGTQPNSNATRIDGAVSMSIWVPHHVGYVQPAETIETVNISTNNFDADLGMAGGAASTVITKSGTNQLRGSAFEFLNRDEFNSNSFFNNAFDLPKTPLSRNIYGGTVGGPIVKNKFFYFGSWEKFQDRRTSNVNYGVPTARMREGDFGEVAAAYAGFRLYDPSSGGPGARTQFPNFAIPGSMIDPISRDVIDYYPMPNTTQDLNSNQLLDDYTVPRQVRVDRHNFDTKFTWQRTDAHACLGSSRCSTLLSSTTSCWASTTGASATPVSTSEPSGIRGRSAPRC